MRSNEKMQQIFESMSYDQSEPDFDHKQEEIKLKNRKNSNIIEKNIKGLIAYYNQIKNKIETNPNDMTSVEDLEELKTFVTKSLNQFNGWS